MSELICPKTGVECQNFSLCQPVNDFLDDAVIKVRKEVDGIDEDVTSSFILRELRIQGHSFGTELYPTQNREDPKDDYDEPETNINICPRDLLLLASEPEGLMLSPKIAIAAVGEVCLKAIKNVTEDLVDIKNGNVKVVEVPFIEHD